MTEKTGLEKIDEILLKVSSIEKRFSNIEFLLKELLNKSNGHKIDAPISTAKISAPKEMSQIAVVEQIDLSTPKIGDPPIGTNPNTKVKVMGQIKNKDERVVSGASVKIYDMSGNMIKDTKTNRSGEWISFLLPGKYKAEYFLENMIDNKVIFNVVAGQTLIRVAQPKEQ